jgi:hypothetical protein
MNVAGIEDRAQEERSPILSTTSSSMDFRLSFAEERFLTKSIAKSPTQILFNTAFPNNVERINISLPTERV